MSLTDQLNSTHHLLQQSDLNLLNVCQEITRIVLNFPLIAICEYHEVCNDILTTSVRDRAESAAASTGCPVTS